MWTRRCALVTVPGTVRGALPTRRAVPGTVPGAACAFSRIGCVIELGHVTDRKPPFKYAAFARVGFSDTDAQGVVYYGRYMPYFDLARVEYHRSLDMLRAEPQEREFVMRAMHVEYHQPARFDDLIEVDVRISRIGTTSVSYEFAAYLEGETLT